MKLKERMWIFVGVTSEDGLLGDWGHWRSWGYCTMTCGIGVRMRQRLCLVNSHVVEEACTGHSRVVSTINLSSLKVYLQHSMDFNTYILIVLIQGLQSIVQLKRWFL